MALLGDFFEGLSRGWLSYWIVALGPLVIIVFARAAWELITPSRPSAPPPNKSNDRSSNRPNTRIEPYVAKDRL
jgi:hypothetical protein